MIDIPEYIFLQMLEICVDSLIKYYVEWCSLNMQPSGGFCTTDAPFVFTDDGLQAVPRQHPTMSMSTFRTECRIRSRMM